MRFFSHKESERQGKNPHCPSCGSHNTGLILYHGTDRPGYVKVWRGQRSFTYRCFDCGMDFYSEGPPEEPGRSPEDRLVDDEEALRYAEDEIAREVEEDDDRMYQ
jgi:hypothetical protein